MKNLKMYLGFIAFSLLISISSCDDNEPVTLTETIVKGIVKDAGKGTPLENATVVLIKQEWSVQSGGFSSIEDTIRTDINGAYEFRFRENRSYDYYISAYKDGYWELSSPALVPESYQENIMDVHIYPYAWLKLHVKNINPFDDNDLLTAYTHPIVGASPQNHYGRSIDFYVRQEVKGNKDIPLIWWVTKDGMYQEFRDTILCEGGDTTLFELFY